MPQKNWPLLIKTAEQIMKNPDSHNQASWCGCFARWAAHLDPRLEPVTGTRAKWLLDRALDPAEFVRVRYIVVPESVATTGDRMPYGLAHVSEAAQTVLGLTWNEAGELFDYDRTLPDILRMLGEWAELDCVTLPESLLSVAMS